MASVAGMKPHVIGVLLGEIEMDGLGCCWLGRSCWLATLRKSNGRSNERQWHGVFVAVTTPPAKSFPLFGGFSGKPLHFPKT